jgi:hypothetical protein
MRRSSRTPEVVLQADSKMLSGAFQTSLRAERAQNSHTLFAPALTPHPGPSSTPNVAAVARELRRTRGLDACPRLSKGMSRRLQQPTIFDFQRRTPTSRIAIRLWLEPLGRASVGESLHSRRGSRFGASISISTGCSPDERPSTVPLISRHITIVGRGRRSRVETISTEPPVTVRARLP